MKTFIKTFRLRRRRPGFQSAIKVVMSLLTTAILEGIGQLPATAAACSGTGQILSGEGQGGLVSLSAQLNRHQGHYQLQFLSGPSASAEAHPVSPAQRQIRTRTGQWQIEALAYPFPNPLVLIFYQASPYRVIRYALHCPA